MKSMDLRVQKTYTALLTSLNTLLKEKSFEDISITEICDLAMIRRQTFYKHFIDKYDFLTYFVKTRINKIFEEAFNQVKGEEKSLYPLIFKQLIEELDEGILLIFKLQMQTDIMMELESIQQFGINKLKTMESDEDEKKGESFLDYKRHMLMGLTINSVYWYKQNQENITYEEILIYYNKLLQAIQ